jgi:hypothetical protein
MHGRCALAVDARHRDGTVGGEQVRQDVRARIGEPPRTQEVPAGGRRGARRWVSR